MRTHIRMYIHTYIHIMLCTRARAHTHTYDLLLFLWFPCANTGMVPVLKHGNHPVCSKIAYNEYHKEKKNTYIASIVSGDPN